MKSILTILTLLAICSFSYGQKAMTFTEARTQNIMNSAFDSIYKSAIHVDTSLAVFKTNQEEFAASYQKMLQDFGQFLKKDSFIWEKPTRGFNRIYFNKDGGIDYFLFSFRPNQLTVEQEAKFKELLNKFIQDYKLPLSAKTGFAQCSPVVYKP